MVHMSRCATPSPAYAAVHCRLERSGGIRQGHPDAPAGVGPVYGMASVVELRGMVTELLRMYMMSCTRSESSPVLRSDHPISNQTSRIFMNKTVSIYGRWIMLVVFMFIAAMNQLLWITFARSRATPPGTTGYPHLRIAILSGFMLCIVVRPARG